MRLWCSGASAGLHGEMELSVSAGRRGEMELSVSAGRRGEMELGEMERVRWSSPCEMELSRVAVVVRWSSPV